MSIEFDREAVGVSAKEQWNDCEEFGALFAYLRETVVAYCASKLPSFDGPGTEKLDAALKEYQAAMRDGLGEFSNACAVLGSGAQGATADFDETESRQSEAYKEMEAILGGGEDS
ncbi:MULTISPECIES: hypothetical protein [unclassified Actinobaculum]|uniref:hypothetical protein n=1 Tax=unclassified Actinobaculum TaxID=2609299 RepID=UPI000D528BA4|nr:MULTISPECIES: hypothetical protein [unclassified Actinobaculum]AWE41769.1 hypothetical protein DDD63_02225 [Actinobaculum sp. 313]RTE50313.1 hypothetical protein EKN07_03675 [Actinobaculum sp. 352]